MAVSEKVYAHFESLLPEDETVQVVELAQLKPGGGVRRGAADVALSTAVAAITNVGMMRLSAPAPVYVAVSEQRIAVRLRGVGRRPVGELVAEFPRWAVDLSVKEGILRTLLFTERSTGELLFRLNFGLRKAGIQSVVAAAA